MQCSLLLWWQVHQRSLDICMMAPGAPALRMHLYPAVQEPCLQDRRHAEEPIQHIMPHPNMVGAAISQGHEHVPAAFCCQLHLQNFVHHPLQSSKHANGKLEAQCCPRAGYSHISDIPSANWDSRVCLVRQHMLKISRSSLADRHLVDVTVVSSEDDLRQAL